MSQEDVKAVFGPQWIQDALDRERDHTKAAEHHIIGLRSWLRAYNPQLPDPYDGEAWHAVLSEFVNQLDAKP